MGAGPNDIRIFQLTGSDYDSWLRRTFTDASVNNPALEASVWGPNADPDKDRLPNLVEAYAGFDPLTGQSDVMGRAGYDAAADEFWFRWRQGAEDYGVRAAPQWSENFIEWHGNGEEGVHASIRTAAALDGATEWEARLPSAGKLLLFWRFFLWRE
ncbi:MAG: hypothetical protein ACR2OZ_04325 [Verrucomicrobiales bacterium]